MTEEILTQKDWSEQALFEAGFKYYKKREKRVVLARQLPPAEAPLKITYHHDTLVATAGYMICFQAGWRKRKSLYEYPHWPVAPDHFADTYIAWTGPGWKPARGQKHLLSLGCRPYYNPASVWAKKLKYPQKIQGVEHNKPFEVPKDAWLILGSKGSTFGAPYWNTDRDFRKHFETE